MLMFLTTKDTTRHILQPKEGFLRYAWLMVQRYPKEEFSVAGARAVSLFFVYEHRADFCSGTERVPESNNLETIRKGDSSPL